MEGNITSYCRKPPKTTNSEKFPEGGCPALLFDLLEELKEASEIHVAAYLFNNPIYLDFLKKLAADGCIISITSLPIQGYNDKKYKVKGYQEKVSGREMAINIYEDILASENIDLRIFPHMYMWYGALYADGGASYSFHVKAVYAKFRNGDNKCILSSGNFMFTDPPHSDNLIIIKNNPEYECVFVKFFDDVESLAIPYENYKRDFQKPEDDFFFSLLGKEIDLSSNFVRNCFFSAPFYTVDGLGSNHYAGNRIIEVIKSAENRIWVCTQHFHDVLSFDLNRETIIKAIYDASLGNKRLDLRFLKQVPHSSLADKRRAAITETLFQFVVKSEQRSNKLVHEKFIIVDNTLIITTANYTSTQFAFGKRTMDMKFDGNKKSKEDYFSEVNGFVIFPNCPNEVLSYYINHFNQLWDEGVDIKIML